jgi:hypothetical protein
MDIIITGEPGAGKTAAAETLIKFYRPKYGKHLHDSDVLYMHNEYHSPGLLTQMLRAARVRAVVFDGCITTPADLLNAVTAVKEYRMQINADILAIYVAQGEAVMLTDGTSKSFGGTIEDLNLTDTQKDEFAAAFKEATPYDPSHVVQRSDVQLYALWSKVYKIVDKTARDTMDVKLRRYMRDVGLANSGLDNSVTVDYALRHLNPEDKITMHEFLLDLKHKYE